VPLETRKELLGHKSGDIITHYSAPEIAELVEAANRVAETSLLTTVRPVERPLPMKLAGEAEGLLLAVMHSYP
jgi:hypothetical protein